MIFHKNKTQKRTSQPVKLSFNLSEAFYSTLTHTVNIVNMCILIKCSIENLDETNEWWRQTAIERDRECDQENCVLLLLLIEKRLENYRLFSQMTNILHRKTNTFMPKIEREDKINKTNK